MKAKSWKKFVQKERSQENDAGEKGKKIPDFQSIMDDPLDTAIEQNDTLKELMSERKKLEQKMGDLTGDTGSDAFGAISRGALGEIPSIAEKKKREARWEEEKRKQIEALRAKKEKAQDFPLNSNATSPDSRSPKAPTDFLGKIAKKKEKNPFDSIKDKADDFEKRQKKIKQKADKAKREVKRFADGIDDAQKELDRFAEESKEFGGSSEIDKIKDRFGTGSKLDKKMEKITDSFNKKRGGEKLDERWDQLKKKKRQLKKIKDKYEARKKRLLSTDGAKLDENDENRKRLQEERLAKKREQEKREQEKEEKRNEEREAKRNEEREAQRNEEREAERKEQREAERREEQKAERRKEEKRARKREERKRKKKDRF